LTFTPADVETACHYESEFQSWVQGSPIQDLRWNQRWLGTPGALRESTVFELLQSSQNANVGLEDDRNQLVIQLDHAMKNAEDVQDRFRHFEAELNQTNGVLNQANAELNQTRAELNQTKAEFLQTQEYLAQLSTHARRIEGELLDTCHEAEHYRKRLEKFESHFIVGKALRMRHYLKGVLTELVDGSD
jgi:chromosome segregation ATPase